jgi:hypothetical protein
MRRYLSMMLFFFMFTTLLSGCSTPMVHKINFARDYTPAMVNRVAILNFNRGNDVSIHPDIVIDKFTAALLGSRFKIVDRADIKKVLEEAKFQHTAAGIIDDTTKERLKQLGADTILTGTLHTYREEKKNNFVMYAEVYVTAKLTKVETGEILWSAEILKKEKAENVGEKKILKVYSRESEADSAGSLLDEIITEMADSFKEKKSVMDKIKVW